MEFSLRFAELAAAFRCCDAQLQCALTADDGTAGHARLLRMTADHLARIEAFTPGTRDEAEDLLDFLTQLRVTSGTANLSAILRAGDAVRRFREGSATTRPAGPVRMQPVPHDLLAAMEGDELARFVVASSGRLSALGRNRRYLAVSPAEAAAIGLSAERVAGRHLMEIIGCRPAQTQQLRRFDLAVAGRPQVFVASCRDRGRTRSCRVRLMPVRDRANRVYAVLRHVVPHQGEPDQTSPGST